MTRLNRIWSIGLAVATLLAAGLLGQTAPAGAQEKIRLYDGPPQGTWRPIANNFKRAIEEKFPNADVTIEPGGGLSNVIAVEAGQGEIGMVASAPLILGADGKPPFKAATKKVSVLATLYPQPFYLMTFDKGVNSVADLKGKRVSVTPKGYASEQVNQLILKTVDMSYDDIEEQYLGEIDAANSMRDGHLDAIMGMGDIPYAIVVDLASTGKLRLIPLAQDHLDRLQKINRGFVPITVKGGTYQDTPDNYPTFAAMVLMIANTDVSAATAKGITQALVEVLPKMKKNFNAFKTMTPEAMAQTIGVDFHPGALEYYKEAGLVK